MFIPYKQTLNIDFGYSSINSSLFAFTGFILAFGGNIFRFNFIYLIGNWVDEEDMGVYLWLEVGFLKQCDGKGRILGK